MELVSVCAWCPTEMQIIPEGKDVTDTICTSCLEMFFPKEAPKVLALQQARRKVELANPFLAQQTF